MGEKKDKKEQWLRSGMPVVRPIYEAISRRYRAMDASKIPECLQIILERAAGLNTNIILRCEADSGTTLGWITYSGYNKTTKRYEACFMRDISLRIDAQQEGIDFIRQNRVPNIEPEKESGDGYKGRANYTKLGRSSSGQSGPIVYKNPRFGKGTEFT